MSNINKELLWNILYNNNVFNNIPNSNLDAIKNIFEEMTIEEKNKILGGNFERLWCDMWLLDRVEKKGPYKKEFYKDNKAVAAYNQ